MHKWILFFLFPTIFLFLFVSGSIHSPDQPSTYLTLFLGLWMITWWIFDVLPLGITALLPLIILPVLKIMPLNEVSAKYANPVIFLFLGGFMLARALEKTELNKRISLHILKWTAHSDKGIVLGFIIATAFLSMWISNTATAVMMLPIAVSVMNFLKHQSMTDEKSIRSLSLVTYLSVAYSANIGGIMTPIGSPPNVVFIGYLNDNFNLQIDFWLWLLILVPVAILILVFQFFWLNYLFPYKVQIDKNFKKFVKDQIALLGLISSGQKVTLTIFFLTCFFWITKDVWNYLFPNFQFNDTSVAILGGLLLFLIPVKNSDYKRVLDKSDIHALPWNIVLLFGGGIALADAMEKAGYIHLATDFVVKLDFSNPYIVVLILTAICLTLTEIMSNVALCVVALPLIMKLGEVYGVSPILMGLPATIAASMAFTMPISTPPNAIVFGTNQIRIQDMMKAGAIMNLMSVLIIMTVGWLLMKLIL